MMLLMRRRRCVSVGCLLGRVCEAERHTKVVGGYDDAVLEFDGHDGGSCDNGLLCVCRGGVVLHE